jgi:hypothetical protein
MVKPFVTGNKNDVADARAIWTAVQQPGIKTVACILKLGLKGAVFIRGRRLWSLWAVRRRRIPLKSIVSCLCRFGKARVARFNLGCEARLIAVGTRA